MSMFVRFCKSWFAPIVCLVLLTAWTMIISEPQFLSQVWHYNTSFQAPNSLQETASPETVRHGGELFNEHCSTCHGINGIGQFLDSPMGGRRDGLIIAPAMDSTGHAMAHHENALFFVTKFGSVWTANSPMVGWEGTLSDDEMVAIVQWVKTTWTAEQLTMQEAMYDHPIP